MNRLGEDIRSTVSNKTQQLLQDVAAKTASRIYSLEGVFQDEEMRAIWNAFGLYVSRNLRMGRGVVVPKLGLFTFTAPEVNLGGVTNPEDRNILPRTPVFVVSKEFVKGRKFTPGIFYHQDFGKGVRPFAVHGVNGEIPQTKLNMVEISSYANMDKDKTTLALNRVIKQLSEQANLRASLDVEVPNVGVLRLRNNIIAVAFNDLMVRDTRAIVSQSIDMRKRKGQMQLTKDNLMRLSRISDMRRSAVQKGPDFLDIDEGTKKYITNQMGIFFNPTLTGFNKISSPDRTVSSRPFTSGLLPLGATAGSAYAKRQLRLQYNFAFQQLQQWVRSKKFNSEESFLQFCRHCLPNSISRKSIMTADEVWKGLKCVSPETTQEQANELFRLLDFNKDGVVTLDDWAKVIGQSGHTLLNRLLQATRGMAPEAFLRCMSIKPSKLRLSLFDLRDGFVSFLKATTFESMELATLLTDGADFIDLAKLLQKIEIYDERVKQIKGHSNDEVLSRLKLHLASIGGNTVIFCRDLVALDPHRTGTVEQNSLAKLLEKVGFVTTVAEKVNLFNSLSPDKGRVRIEPLLSLLRQHEGEAAMAPEPVNYFQKLQKYLGENKESLRLPTSLANLASQLKSQFPGHSLKDIEKECSIVDIDADGIVSKDDLETFLSRRAYMELATGDEMRRSLYPKGRKDGIEKLIAEVKQAIAKKNYSLHDFFNMIDTGKDGLIDIIKLSRGLDRVVKFDQSQKDAIFAQIDAQGHGVITYKNFLEGLSGKKEKATDDSFDWAEQVVARMRRWYREIDKPVEDAFKLIDADFDGRVGDADLNNYLTRYLGFHSSELTQIRLARLKKILDTFKRSALDFTDFKRVFQPSSSPVDATVTAGKFFEDSSSWLSNAKQQLGLVISRQFSSLSQAFSQIAKNSKTLSLANFCDFISRTKALSGFFENAKMREKLFAELDPHKKGFISETDFVNAFGGFDWEGQMTLEVVDYVRAHFKTPKEAYSFFSGAKGEIRFEEFTKAVENMLPNRFTSGDMTLLWRKIAGGHESLGRKEFVQAFKVGSSKEFDYLWNLDPRDDWQYTSFNCIKGTVPRTMQNFYTEAEKIGEISDKMMKQLREILRASPLTLEEAFEQADASKGGLITNLQFKKVLRSLGIALTSKEIDILLNYCDFRQANLVKWRSFVSKFKLDYINKFQDDIWARAKGRLHLLNDKLYSFMISPNEAFRKYNDSRTNFMSFEQFHQLLQDLSRLAGEPVPTLALARGMFDEIDVRKDGKIDHQEMIETFKFFPPPMIVNGHNSKPGPRLELQPLNSLLDEYTLLGLFGRNKKYLLQEFNKMAKKDQALLPAEDVAKVLLGLCEHRGVKASLADCRQQLTFAEKDNLVDYRLLLSTFKQRMQRMEQFPKHSAF